MRNKTAYVARASGGPGTSAPARRARVTKGSAQPAAERGAVAEPAPLDGAGDGSSSMVERAYKELKARILTNRFQSGEYILEDELSKLLQMSRTPVREALVQLQNEGHVQLVPRRGARIVPLTIRDIREIYDLLQTLEAHAAELISVREDRQQLVDALRGHIEEMRAALSEDDLDRWAAANERFHRELVAASGNERLIRFTSTLLDQSHRVRVFTLRLRKPPGRSTQNHADLLRAIAKGDAQEARSIHVRHKDEWLAELTSIVERVGLHKL